MQRSKQLDLYKPTITKWINDSLAASRGGAAAAVSSGPVPWSNVSKAGSSIADLESHSHGSLTDLDGDHHTRYLHLDIPRTVNASHTWSANQRYDGSVGIGVWPPAYRLEVGDRMRLRSGALGEAGLFLADAAGNNRGFVGLLNDTASPVAGIWVGDWFLRVDGSGNTSVRSSLRTESFTSGFTGSGFRLDNGLLTAGKTTGEMDDLIVRGRMRVYELLVQQIRATNGSIFVSSTGKVKTVTGAGPYSIETDATHGFLVNDLIRAQRFTGNGVYQSNLQVTAVADTTHFTATLSSGDAPAAGMEFVRLGNTSDSTRQNSIYMSADDTYNPFIDIVTGVNSFAAFGSTATRKGRIGNLQGLFSVAGEHGIFFGNGQAATSQYMRLSSYTQELHNLPINMYNGSGSLFLTLSTDGLSLNSLDQSYARIRWQSSGVTYHEIGGHTYGDSYNRTDIKTWSSTKSATRIGAWNLSQVNSPVAYVEVSQDTFASQILLNAEGATVGSSSTPTSTLDVYRGSLSNGTATFRGITYASHFNYSTDEDTYIRGGKTASQILIGDANTGNVRLAEGGGNVGINVASPEVKLHVAGNIWARSSSGGFVAMQPGDATHVGYVGWHKADGTRLAYAGDDNTNLALVLENSADLAISGGDVTMSADLLVSGVTRLAGGYLGLAGVAEPSTSAVYAYLFVDSADGDLKVKFKNGTLKTLATN